MQNLTNKSFFINYKLSYKKIRIIVMKQGGNQSTVTKINPRSMTRIIDNNFVKTSLELNLKGEAEELERCIQLQIVTPNVKATEFISFNQDTNELQTRYISDGFSLYNYMWNNTSVLGLLRGKSLDPEQLYSRISEIGSWLNKYHNSTEHSNHVGNAVDRLIDLFQKKISAIGKNSILKPSFLSQAKETYFSSVRTHKRF